MSDRDKYQCVLGIVRIVERIQLREYDERLGEDYLTVWVNIDGAMAERWNAYREKMLTLKRLAGGSEGDPTDTERGLMLLKEAEQVAVTFYADLWEMPVEDAQAIYTANRPLFTWCANRSWELITEYRTGRPKGFSGK